MISVDDFYKEVRECIYKGEHYSVRDNGAVLRHSREGKRVRKDDNIWTFGKTNIRTWYKEIGNERVHRIVAFAFLGEPPTPQHVVDHIDTNRQNNRPENLRWVTKLENALNNPITRSRIIYRCGSIEAFINNPSLLRGHESDDPNFIWMRTVSPSEAHASYERMKQWAKEPHVSKGGKMGEWLFDDIKPHISSNSDFHSGVSKHSDNFQESPTVSASEIIQISQSARIPEKETIKVSNETESLTPNVIQVKWRTPTEFPLCPQEQVNQPLAEYQSRLIKDSIFCHNQYQDSLVIDTALVDNESTLYVMCKSSDAGAIKPWSLAKITYREGKYYHESIQTYFQEEGAKKYFTLAQGKEWTDGEVFDDFV